MMRFQIYSWYALAMIPYEISINRIRTGLKGFFEKSLKIKYTFKSTGKSLKGLEKSLNSSIFCRT